MSVSNFISTLKNKVYIIKQEEDKEVIENIKNKLQLPDNTNLEILSKESIKDIASMLHMLSLETKFHDNLSLEYALNAIEKGAINDPIIMNAIKNKIEYLL